MTKKKQSRKDTTYMAWEPEDVVVVELPPTLAESILRAVVGTAARIKGRLGDLRNKTG